MEHGGYIFSFLILLIMLWVRYFLLNGKGEKIEEQTGTIRTNCVDCLDRTNVTQVYTVKYSFCCTSNLIVDIVNTYGYWIIYLPCCTAVANS